MQFIKYSWTGFEPRISGVRCNCSTNCATTTAQFSTVFANERLEVVPWILSTAPDWSIDLFI